jgi:uncharacterized damage-inducible protein DinB
MKPHMISLTRFTAWANARTLAAVRAAGDADGRLTAILAHVTATQEVWLDRVAPEYPEPESLWPGFGLDECAERLEASSAAWVGLAERAPVERFYESITYTRSGGERRENTLRDIIAHVTMHGVHHRSVIGQMLAARGAEPPANDFILYTWEVAADGAGG